MKYENKHITITHRNQNDLNGDIKKLNEDGWEVVAIETINDKKTNLLVKRLIGESGNKQILND